MVVIIQHQDDELKLRKLQKNLINQLNNYDDARGQIFYELIPLWINPEYDSVAGEKLLADCKDQSALKEKSRQITKVLLTDLFFDSQREEVAIHVIISTKAGDIATTLPLASAYKKENMTFPDDLLKKISLEELPLSLKIFRLGIATKPEKNSVAVSDSVWVKLKA